MKGYCHTVPVEVRSVTVTEGTATCPFCQQVNRLKYETRGDTTKLVEDDHCGHKEKNRVKIGGKSHFRFVPVGAESNLPPVV